MPARASLWLAVLVAACCSAPAGAQLLGQAVDASDDFRNRDSVYFVPQAVTRFDPATGGGSLRWERYRQQPNLSFNKVDLAYTRAESNEFPATEYDRDPELPFSVTFLSPRAVRLRFATRDLPGGLAEQSSAADAQSLMLAGPLPRDGSWRASETDDAITYRSVAGEVRVTKSPWRIELRDPAGKLITRTRTLNDPATYSAPTPFSFVRRSRDFGHSTAASFTLAPDEKIFGCGESFTRLDKRGQKVVLYTRDGMGVQGNRMYKPVPFFMSSAGYGMFIHTSAPVSCDFGADFDEAAVIATGDEQLDLFLFLGTPKEILTEYTAVTGRSPVPPLWSFGLWMSRITYKSEAEVRDVAAKLREHRIPCDVIHLDTGWFETDWQCNYKFAPSRFDDPQKMIADLKTQGLRVSLWQLPYFTAKNELYPTIVQKGYAVRTEGGGPAYLDAVLDFSNPATIQWYQGLIEGLLKLGVGAIKVDFGEDAPLDGIYASGRTGWYEHNLYPLRYNRAVAEATRRATGESIIWARSAWAGSQRYPLHWGGDAENTDSAMAATLRAGLSLGLCGFSYWSHDVGGFVGLPSEDLYRRWLPFGVLTSHTRCHGAPPREPWEFSDKFEADFRRAVELKYQLMPYIVEQAERCSAAGHPMLRTLFFEFPDDPGSWLVEDQYMFGSDLLVAPIFTPAPPAPPERTGASPTPASPASPAPTSAPTAPSLPIARTVYLPPGEWIDYQTNKSYPGARFHQIAAGEIPIVLLVRSGATIPHAPLAQSTADIDFSKVQRRPFGQK
ncbi:MAG TPA: TIM-barrel domain-containing protein [Lacipirellulaceae bacterium]|nr:TIM-barrel domain-containing protein [Lacipirellulaceae bacterium]